MLSSASRGGARGILMSGRCGGRLVGQGIRIERGNWDVCI